MTLFTQADHQKAEVFLKEKPGNALLVTLTNGVHFALIALDPFSPLRIAGRDEEGSEVVIGSAWVGAFMLAEDFSGGPTYQLVGGPRPIGEAITGTIEEFGMSSNMEEWQTAFMELRAACDESEDQRVRDAAARLDRVEADGAEAAGEPEAPQS